MKLIALDLGTALGWAHDEYGTIQSGTLDCEGDCLGGKLRKFCANLHRMLPRFGRCYYELPHAHSGRSRDIVYGQQGILVAELYRLRIPAHAVAANTSKKWATGDGRAGKLQMMRRAHELLGRVCVPEIRRTPRGREYLWCSCGMTDHESDAVCVLGYGRSSR